LPACPTLFLFPIGILSEVVGGNIAEEGLSVVVVSMVVVVVMISWVMPEAPRTSNARVGIQ